MKRLAINIRRYVCLAAGWTRRPIYNYVRVPRCVTMLLLASPSTSPRSCNSFVSENMAGNRWLVALPRDGRKVALFGARSRPARGDMVAGWFGWRERATLRRAYLRRQQAMATAKDRDAGLAGTRDDHARATPPLASGLASGKPLSHKLLPLPGTRSRHPASTVAPHGSRLATHELLAQWAVEEVLLSSDLLDAILYHLDDIEDGA